MFSASLYRKLVSFAVFFLPWQTLWIFYVFPIGDGLSAFSVFGFYLSQVLIFVTALYGFLLLNNDEKWRVANTVIAYGVIAFVFTSLSRFPWISVSALWHIGFGCLLYAILQHQQANIEMAKKAFLYGLIVPCCIGIFQTVFGFFPEFTILGLAERNHLVLGESVILLRDTTRLLRSYGSFPHPNIFGGYLAVAIVLLLSLWQNSKMSWHKWQRMGLLAVFSLTLFLTFSRSAWLALFLALMMTWYVFVKQAVPKLKNIILYTAGYLVIILSITYFTEIGSWRPFSHQEFESRSVSERRIQFQEYPSVVYPSIISGSGIGTYPWAVEKRYPNEPFYRYQPIHQVWLLLFAELGLIGMTFLCFIIYQQRKLIKVYPPIFYLTFSALLVVSFFDHYLITLWPGIALTAFVFSLSRS